MNTVKLICFGGPSDGHIEEVVWNKKSWVSPQRELYLVRKAYVHGSGWKKLLVWHRIDWDLVDKMLLSEMIAAQEHTA